MEFLPMSSIFQQYSQPAGLSPDCICLRCSFFCLVLCIALGLVLISSKSILCGKGWWQLVVIPLPNHMVALYHLAPQKLADLVSSIFFLYSRSSIFSFEVVFQFIVFIIRIQHVTLEHDVFDPVIVYYRWWMRFSRNVILLVQVFSKLPQTFPVFVEQKFCPVNFIMQCTFTFAMEFVP